MIVMVSNHTGLRTGYLAGMFPDRVGHLFSPRGKRGPYEFMPFALDNDAFALGDKWNEAEWIRLMKWAAKSGLDPEWALVPDKVGDRDETLRKWEKYASMTAGFGWPLAFAVQDGMVIGDVPTDASVIFVGGSTEWKWETMPMWCAEFDHVHVGRVNAYHRLWECHRAGAKSTDGTGWMRGDRTQFQGLLNYLAESSQSQHHGFSFPGY